MIVSSKYVPFYNCFLNNLNSLIFFYLKDYPSVGQILQKARENNINVIFVIGGADNKLVRNIYYDKLAALLPGGFNNASELTPDASNILDIVGNSYRVRSLPFFFLFARFKLTIVSFHWYHF